VFDGTCVIAVHFGMLGPLARGERLATDYAEATKRRAKARLAKQVTKRERWSGAASRDE